MTATAEPPAADPPWAARAEPLGFRPLLAVAALLAAALLWKNWDLLRYAAPYFEDGCDLFARPRSPGHSLLLPMGGGYVHLLPRAYAWLAAVLVPAHLVPAAFVAGCLLLKVVSGTVLFAFLRRIAGLPTAHAVLGALMAAFLQSANFTLDTLLVSSIWTLVTTSFFLVFLVPVLGRGAALLALLFVAGSVWSSLAGVAVAAAAAVLVLFRAAPAPRARVLGFAAVVLLAWLGYLRFGIRHADLLGGTVGQTPLLQQAWQFGVVFFERAFVEAVLGHQARAWLATSVVRAELVVAGAAVLLAALLATGRRALRRRRPATSGFAVATALATVTLSALVAFSGRYHDGQGGAQHYYVQSQLLLAGTLWGLSAWSRHVGAAFALFYLGTALVNLEAIRFVGILGDLQANHRAFQEFARAHEAAPEVPAVLSQPEVWGEPWTIRLPARQ